MVRIKASVASKKRKNRVMKKAKGQFGHRKSRYQQAKRTINKGMVYATRDRKVKKREYRSLWIVRIKAACEAAGIDYSRFMNGLTVAKVELNRKVIAELAVNAPEAFSKLVALAKASQPAEKAAV